MIAFPLKLESQSDAYFIRDATGRIIADMVLEQDDAKAICRALTNENERKEKTDANN